MKHLAIICVGFIASLMLVCASYAQIDPETCVGMWLFDGSAAEKAVDSSQYGNDGAFIGDPGWGGGKFGSALELSGIDNYVEVPDAESLDTILNEGLTIVAWVNGEFRAGDWHGIVTKAAGWQVDMCYLLQRNGNGFFEFAPFSQNADSAWVPAVQPVDDVWYHIAAVYDGANASIYIDGEFGASSPYLLGIADTDAPVIIGSNYPDAGQCIKGLIDEVAIFSAALTDEDIQTVMNEGLEAATGIIAVEPLDKLATTWGHIRRE